MNDNLIVVCACNVAETIRSFTTAALPLETGGLLLGWWKQGSVVLKEAIEVADPNATSVSWSRNQEAAQEILDRALARHAHPWLGYVGDWHSHPKACLPSSTDLNTIVQASLQFMEPLVLLIHTPPATFEVRAAHNGHSRVPCVRYSNPAED